MAPTSSSTKKAARLAQKGKGQKVRFQGGTLFPFIVALVIVLGFGLVVYARQSRPAAGASAPTVEDHWHHLYGFYLCDSWFQLNGDGEAPDANGRPTNVQYARTGVHSHDDGLIHWHAFTSLAIGRRANLGLFLKTYDVELTNDKLVFPEDQRSFLPNHQEDGTFENGETQCEITNDDGSTSMVDGELKAVVWNNVSDTDEGRTLIAGFDDIALNMDAMSVVVAFVPDDEDITMPPWAPEFDTSVLNDSGQLPPEQLFPGAEVDVDGNVTDGSTPLEQEDVGPAVSTDTTDAPTSSEPASTEPASTEPASTEPASTEPASTEPATTEG